MSPGEARRIYDEWHARAESPDAVADAPWHQLLFAHLEPARDIDGRRVLEIGCGRGELAAHFAASRPSPRLYVAADFAATAVALARRRISEGAWHLSRKGGWHPWHESCAKSAEQTAFCWTLADIQALGLRDGTFDTVISCETIEHLPDPVTALREVHRVLRDGGRLFLTTPNYLGLFGAYRAYLRATGRRYTEGGQPICRLTSLPRTVAWVRRAGLRVLALRADGHYALRPGRVPVRQQVPAWLSAVLWPFGLHSIVVAEKSGPRAGAGS